MAADSDPTYTTVPGKLAPLLKKMRETGVPPKATKAWLKTIGFTSSNDGSLLNVLRSIGFIDSPGVPTPVWKEYRGRDYKEILGRAVKSGYESLYAVYPDAHERPNADLSHVFSSQTTSGKQTVDKMVSTFKALAGEAEFSRADSGQRQRGGRPDRDPTNSCGIERHHGRNQAEHDRRWANGQYQRPADAS